MYHYHTFEAPKCSTVVYSVGFGHVYFNHVGVALAKKIGNDIQDDHVIHAKKYTIAVLGQLIN